MKKKIDRNTLDMLGVLKRSMLMTSKGILFVVDYFKHETIEEEEKSFFGLKKKVVKNIYLTDLTIIGYNTEGKFMGTLSDEQAWSLIYFYNLYTCRQNWVDFEEELKAFGFELTKIKQHGEVKQD